MKAVIIDDDFKIRYILKSVFSRYKDSLQPNDALQIFSAQDGFEGLGYIFSVRPEVIVIDTTLPTHGNKEIFEYVSSNSSFVDKSRLIVIVEDESSALTEQYKNYKVLVKNDKNFLNDFEFLINSFLLEKNKVMIDKVKQNRFREYITKETIRLANRSDLLKHRSEKANSLPFMFRILSKFIYGLFNVYNEIVLSGYFALFYLLGGRSIDYNQIQQKIDLRINSIRVLPTLSTLAIGIGFIGFKVIVLLGGGLLFFSTNVQGSTVCPSSLTGGPVTTLVSITPSAANEVFDCSAYDVVVASGGEIDFNGFIISDNSAANDGGATILVHSLDVQTGGKISADGKGYTAGSADAGTGTAAASVLQTGGSGGGHGGSGGQGKEDATHVAPNGGTTYGNSDNPFELGGAGGNVVDVGSDVTSGLVSRWDFENNLNDSFGSNNGTPGGVPSYVTGGAQKINSYALTFDGTSYVTLPNSILPANSAGTMSLWFKADTVPTKQYLWALENTGDTPEIRLLLSGGTLDFYGYDGGSYQFQITTAFSDTTSWHHVVGTWQNNDAKLYLDGVSVGSDSSVSITSNNATVNNSLGYYSRDDSGTRFIGKMDDVRLYNRAITASEDLNIYQYGNNPTPSVLAQGGNGGGIVKIVSSTSLIVNGTISANGDSGNLTGSTTSGGGAGGTVYLQAQTFTGSGTISANGGAPANTTYRGGGGGGGRVWMVCDTSNAFSGSATVAGGATSPVSQSGQDGSIIGPTCKPNAPTVLKQYKSDQTTEILQNGLTPENTVVFGTNMVDPDSTDTLQLQIEVRDINTAFTNVATSIASSFVANNLNCTSPLSDCGKIILNNIARGKEYHWQARIKDSKGAYSNWASYGNNTEAQRDFAVTGLATNIQLISGDSQTGVVGTTLADNLVVKITDNFGFPVPGYLVTWSVSNGSTGGQFVGSNVVTDDNGLSSRVYKLGTKTGANQVQASGGGLTGSPISFNFTGTPGTLTNITIQGPSYSLVNTNFDITLNVYDQYNNLKTDYTGTLNFAAVDPNDSNTTLPGNLTPASYQFVLGDAGTKVISTFQFDTQASIKIKASDGSVSSTSNIIAIVTSLGTCPDVDGIIDSNENWTADTTNHGIFDCTNVAEVRVMSGVTLTLTPYDNGDSNYSNDYIVDILANNFVVEANANVNSDGKGYIAGNGPGSGGSYGGYGAAGTPYGDLKNPQQLGSGGTGSGAYGQGGGAIKLDVSNTLTLEGTISANGVTGLASGCSVTVGGSGGSILINTVNLVKSTGSTSLISANGGRGGESGVCGGPLAGSGSGGRIAIYVSGTDNLTSNPNASIQSQGGTSYSGGAGTYYYEGPTQSAGAGIVTVDNNNISTNRATISGTNQIYTFEKIILDRNGNLELTDPGSTINITGSDALTGDGTSVLATFGTINANSLGNINNAGIQVENTGVLNTSNTVNIQSALVTIKGTWNNAQNINLQTNGNLTLYANATGVTNGIYDFGGNLTVSSTSTLTLASDTTNGIGVTLNFTNIDVASGGRISADGQGYQAGSGPGSGGSYGGYGAAGTPYGNLVNPTQLGSGGTGSGGYSYGGGAMTLNIADTLTLEGTISANGATGLASGCFVSVGGSGGSILINAVNLDKSTASSSLISANGGRGGESGVCGGPLAGSGSGGRIAIYVSGTDNLTGNVNTSVQSRGGTSYSGGAGTYYYEGPSQTPGAGIVRVDDNNLSTNRATISGTNQTYTFEKIILTNNGNLELTDPGSTINITGSDALTGDGTSILATFGTINATALGNINNAGIQVENTGVLNTSSTVNIQSALVTIKGTWNNAQNINLQSNGNLNLYANATGVTNGIYNFGGNLTVSSTSVMTLFSDTTNGFGVDLKFQNINVASGGKINADGQGYQAGSGPGAGGSYGGYGAAGTPYGDLENPIQLGSGGTGSGGYSYGGGAIKLDVSNTLTLEGTISADGATGLAGGCFVSVGGSGGSILINTVNLIKTTGSTSLITTNGGRGGESGVCGGPLAGSGSGGRIAIYVSGTDTLTSNPNASIQSRGGTSYSGGAGTYYYEGPSQTPGAGIVKVDNNNISPNRAAISGTNQTYTFEKILLTRTGNLELTDPGSTINVTASDALAGDGTSILATFGTINATVLGDINTVGIQVENSGVLNTSNTVNIQSALVTIKGTWNNVQNVNLQPNGNLTLYANATGVTGGVYNFGGNLVVSSTSTLTLISDTTSDIGVTLNFNNINVASGGKISADGQGYQAGSGPGSGGSYGGYGGAGAPYGDLVQPTQPGSGGTGSGAYSHGGGAIKLNVADTLDLEGTISANGETGLASGCFVSVGGSGGSILINAANLAKSTGSTSLISANGGRGGESGVCGGPLAGSGSGGRIAIYVSGTDNLTGNVNTSVQSRGGTSYSGGAGTYYYEGPNQTPGAGIVTIDNNNISPNRAAISGTNKTYTFEKITLTNTGNLELTDPGSIINITGSNALTGDGTSILATFGTVNATALGNIINAGIQVENTGILNTSNTVNVQSALVTIKGTWNNVQNINLQSNGNLTLYANATGFANGVYNFGGNLAVSGSSVVTLVGDTTNGIGVTLNFNNINVDDGGKITADAQGYQAGSGPGAGGSYGGYGAAGAPYGDIKNPILLGSGGTGSGAYSHGGGAIKLNVTDTLDLEGTISANGETGLASGCFVSVGGSGGSIFINALHLIKSTSSSSQITVNGGRGGESGVCGGPLAGSGSGGRIAIFANGTDTLTADGNTVIQTKGGNSYSGGPGTYYYEGPGYISGEGDLYIKNDGQVGRGMDFAAQDYTFHNVVIGSNVTIYMLQDLNGLLSPDLAHPGSNVENIGDATAIWNFEENSNGSCTGGGDYCDSSGNGLNLTAFGSTRTQGKVGNGLSLDGSSYAETDVSNLNLSSVTIGMWAKLGQFTATGSNAEELFNVNNIATTSSLDLDNLKQLRWEWPSDLVTGLVSVNKPATMSSVFGGNSYPASNCFDNDTSTFCHSASNSVGNWVQVDLGSVKNIATIALWNRADCCQDRLTDFKVEVSNTGSFTGEQTTILTENNQTVGFPSEYEFSPIDARYVRLTQLNANYLGLGEIKVYDSSTYLPLDQWQHIVVTLDAPSGTRKIYVNGQLVAQDIYNINYNLPISKISFGKGGLGSSTGFVGTIDEAFIYPRALSASEINVYEQTYSWSLFNGVKGRGPILNLTGDFTLQSGALLNAHGLGFPSDSGPGSGVDGQGNSGGSGGGYGGSGGAGQNDGINNSPTGGTVYGSQRQPLSLGSGGGKSGVGDLGGTGGGAVAIRARSGLVTIDGTIDVGGTNGLTASPGGGGGSGGSILIEGNTCNIAGTLNANGGDGGNDTFDGGGGGGGRISILYSQLPCDVTGSVTVAQGNGFSAQVGQIGTYPGPYTIPFDPTYKQQFKSDATTVIPVGGTVDQSAVTVKVSVFDSAASNVDPRNLQAEVEVVPANSSFTNDDTQSTVYKASPILFEGGSAPVVDIPISGLIAGESYKWQARVKNVDESIASNWTEFGNNGSNQPDFTVSTVQSISATASTNQVIAGNPISVTIKALNGASAVDPSYRGTVAFTSNSGTAVLPGNYTFTSGDAGEKTISGFIFTAPGTYTITATDTQSSNLTATTANITVLPTTSTLHINATSNTVEVANPLTITVTAINQNSNTDVNYEGTIHFTSDATNPSAVILPSDYTFTPGDAGTHIFDGGILFSQPGMYIITATDTIDPTLTSSYTVTVAPSTTVQSLLTTNLKFESDKTNVNVGDPVTLTLSALDKDGNVDTTYVGTVVFKSDNPGANLPPNYKFTSSDKGVKIFDGALSFTEPGTYNITVSDFLNQSLTKTLTFTVTGSPIEPPNPCVADPNLTQCQAEVVIGNVTVIPGSPVEICWTTTPATIGYLQFGFITAPTSSVSYTNTTPVSKTYKENNCANVPDSTKDSSFFYQIDVESNSGKKAHYSGIFDPGRLYNGSFFNVFDMIFPLIIGTLFTLRGFFLGLIQRKKRKYWGVIFDVSKSKPLQLVQVHLYATKNSVTLGAKLSSPFEESESSEKIQTSYIGGAISDFEGRYGFVIDKTGYYIVEAKIDGYDEFKKKIYVDPSLEVVQDIPMLQVGTRASIVQKLKMYLKLHTLTIVNILFFGIMLGGFIYSLVAMLAEFNLLNVLIVSLYVAVYIINIVLVLRSYRGGGKVIDQSGKGIGGASVRVYDNERQLKVSLTTSKGMVKIGLAPKTYNMNANKEGYEMSDGELKNGVKLESIDILKNGQLNKNIKMSTSEKL